MKRLIYLLTLVLLVSCGEDNTTAPLPQVRIDTLSTSGHLETSEMNINYAIHNDSVDLLPRVNKSNSDFYDRTCIETNEEDYLRMNNLTKRNLTAKIKFHFDVQRGLVKFRSHIKLFHLGRQVGEHCNHAYKEGRSEYNDNRLQIYFQRSGLGYYLAYEVYSVNGLMILEDKGN